MNANDPWLEMIGDETNKTPCASGRLLPWHGESAWDASCWARWLWPGGFTGEIGEAWGGIHIDQPIDQHRISKFQHRIPIRIRIPMVPRFHWSCYIIFRDLFVAICKVWAMIIGMLGCIFASKRGINSPSFSMHSVHPLVGLKCWRPGQQISLPMSQLNMWGLHFTHLSTVPCIVPKENTPKKYLKICYSSWSHPQASLKIRSEKQSVVPYGLMNIPWQCQRSPWCQGTWRFSGWDGKLRRSTLPGNLHLQRIFSASLKHCP